MFRSVRKFNPNNKWMFVLLLTTFVSGFGMFASASSQQTGQPEAIAAVKAELCYVQKYLAGALCNNTASLPSKRMVFHYQI